MLTSKLFNLDSSQTHREITSQATKLLPDKRHIMKNETSASNQIPAFPEYTYGNAVQYKDVKVCINIY